jgi:TRAP-type C4-dicarboxylate transport system substrate-binding protein
VTGFLRLGSVVAACGALSTVGLGIGRARAADYKLKIGTMGLNDIQHEFLREYKSRVETATKGAISVDLFPGGQLGSIADQVKGLQLGTIEMFVVPPDFLKGIEAEFQVASAPGLFGDIKHAHWAFTEPQFREKFLNVGVSKGIKGVSIWDSGATDYASTTPIRKVEDFKGLKIRVLATEIETKMMAKLGAAGVPMDIADVLPALQRKALDGIRSVASIMDARKFWTTTKFLTQMNDTHIPLVAWVGMPFYSKLPPAHQKTLERIGRELEPLMLERSLALNGAAYESWRKNGAEIIKLSDKDRADFMQRVAAVADEVLGGNAQLKNMYALLKGAAAKTRAG